ncbi:hypothetical protein LIA77_02255 [Sarocladium implicatum]|nr:hypothetical protein LIA77_02255 [Sarocladium implicatum]
MPRKLHFLPFGAVFLAIWTKGAQAQLDVTWRYPSEEGLKFYQRDAVTVSYISDIEKPSLWTFCLEGPEDAQEIILKDKIDDAAPKNGSQEVKINFNTDADECWFNIRDNDDEGNLGANSPHFSVSSDERSQTTLGLGAETTTAPPSSSTSSDEPSSTGTQEQTTTSGAAGGDTDGASDGDSGSSSGGGGLSTGAKAGIGVGVALGIIGIIALAGTFFLMRRKKRSESGTPHETQELHATSVVENKAHWGGGSYQPHEQPPQAQSPPQEMSAGHESERRAGAYEMPG